MSILNINDYGKIVKEYKGKGTLVNSEGKDFKCNFSTCQYSNGYIFVSCEIKKDNEANYLKEAFNYFRNINKLKGITANNDKIIIKDLDFSFSNSSEIIFGATKIIVSFTDKMNKNNATKIKYGIVNFEFSGNKMEFKIDDKKISFKPVSNYKKLIKSIKVIRGIDISCFVEVDMSNKDDEKEINKLIQKLCTFLSLANGNYVNYLYYEIYQENTKVKAIHRNAITKQFTSLHLIPKKTEYIYKKLC